MVAIEPHFRTASHYPVIRGELDCLAVVRTTSPLDGRSRWIEIFSKGVSKALASSRIARDLGIREKTATAMGNDYNDLDLLQWAARRRAAADLLEQRRAAGLVRHCHGDLHLENIVLLDGRPVLFDCIEFNDAFAQIDLLYDLAFLLMDLLDRGFRAAALQLLQATALPLFLVFAFELWLELAVVVLGGDLR